MNNIQGDIDNMETKIMAERARNDSVLNKMKVASQINAELKTEYETQLGLFQDLKGKYQEKVALLSSENQPLALAEALPNN